MDILITYIYTGAAYVCLLRRNFSFSTLRVWRPRLWWSCQYWRSPPTSQCPQTSQYRGKAKICNSTSSSHPLTKWLFRRFRLPLFFGVELEWNQKLFWAGHCHALHGLWWNIWDMLKYLKYLGKYAKNMLKSDISVRNLTCQKSIKISYFIILTSINVSWAWFRSIFGSFH